MVTKKIQNIGNSKLKFDIIDVEIIENKLPGLHQVSPALSVRGSGIRGPVVDDELPKCVEYGRKITIYLTKIETT